MRDLFRWLYGAATDWLTKDGLPPPSPLCDFNRLGFELRAGDVLLVEGRSRVSEVIKLITQSPWSHAALYIGRLHDIRDPDLREVIAYHYDGEPGDQLLIEALIGQGTIVTSLEKYRDDHLRICRPNGLSPLDAEQVIGYTARHLGWDYDMRQMLDLARFFFPWRLLPRRWRSSLFQHSPGKATRTLCSTLLAEAFMAVDFPILPFIDRNQDGSMRFFKRNPRLATPRDFDYSPYFSIIKYPYLGVADIGLYHRLPWTDDEIYNDECHAFRPPPPRPAGQVPEPGQAVAATESAPLQTLPERREAANEAAQPPAAVRLLHAFAFLGRKG